MSDQYLEFTWKRVLMIWWAFSSRALYFFWCGAAFIFIFLFSQGSAHLFKIANVVVAGAASIYALKIVLTMSFAGFRIVLIPSLRRCFCVHGQCVCMHGVGGVMSDQYLEFTWKRVLMIWQAFSWRTLLLAGCVALIGFLLGIPQGLLGVTSTVIVGAGSIYLLRSVLTMIFAGFRIALIPNA
jgi:hypothetical protein